MPRKKVEVILDNALAEDRKKTAEKIHYQPEMTSDYLRTKRAILGVDR